MDSCLLVAATPAIYAPRISFWLPTKEEVGPVWLELPVGGFIPMPVLPSWDPMELEPPKEVELPKEKPPPDVGFVDEGLFAPKPAGLLGLVKG